MEVSHIQSGSVYKVTNAEKTSLVLDLSSEGEHQVIAYSDNEGSNQKWVFETVGNEWTIKNQGSGKYIGVENSNYNDGSKVISVEERFFWNIWPENKDENNDHFKICVPNTTLYLDISNDEGESDIEVREKEDGLNQLWTFDEGKPDIFGIYLQQHKW